jgi:hypothetical protein
MKQTIPAVLLLLFIASVSPAQEKSNKPNFSGSWAMIDSSDNSGTAGTEHLFMRVEHRDPQLKVTIGESVWTLSTDGVENTNRMNGAEVRSRTRWEGDRLITEWVTQADGKTMQHRQAWSLSKDGKRLTLVMRDGDNETTVNAIRQ